jgi:hypothetical protein
MARSYQQRPRPGAARTAGAELSIRIVVRSEHQIEHPFAHMLTGVAIGYGTWVESVVRDIAAGAGVPDFVFRPEVVAKGGGQREVGDSLLWVGRQLVVVSVKSRDPDVGPESLERRDSWLTKNITKAVSQINGTVRTLRTPPQGLALLSERGVRIPWKPDLVDEISGIVVVEHSNLDGFVPDTSEASAPTLALPMEDWLTIHERLWSTSAVVKYMSWRTRSGLPPLPFGSERDVIASSHLAEADLPKATPFEIKPGAWDQLWEERPEIFFGTEPDHRFAMVIDAMIAGAAEQDPLYTSVEHVDDYLHLIEFLDRIPPFVRVGLGERILQKCLAVGEQGGYDAMLAVPHNDIPGLFVFIADDSPREERASRLKGLAIARHTQFRDAMGDDSLVTLGVATEPTPVPGRSHDYVFIRGGVDLGVDGRRARDAACRPLPQAFIDHVRERLAR